MGEQQALMKREGDMVEIPEEEFGIEVEEIEGDTKEWQREREQEFLRRSGFEE